MINCMIIAIIAFIIIYPWLDRWVESLKIKEFKIIIGREE